MSTDYPDWTRALLLLGKSGVDLIPVALDPTGNLYAILQGEYAGALRTVKLDSEGRISAFVIDSADAWGNLLEVGNAELAVRLGSIVRVDRRGSVLFTDSFEVGSSRWWISTAGTGTAHQVTPLYAYSGGYSLRLTAPTEAATGIFARIQTPLYAAARFGASMMLRNEDDFGYLMLRMDIYNGSRLYRARAQIDYNSGKVQLYKSDGTWQDICDYAGLAGASDTFQFLKLVADHSTGYYVRLIYEGNTYDVSAYAMQYVAAAVPAKLQLLIYLYSLAGTNAHAEIDDVVLTTVEP